MRSPAIATSRAICSTLRRPKESASSPVEMAVAARARVEMLAASDVLPMSSPRAAPTRAVEAMFGSEPWIAATSPRNTSASVGFFTVVTVGGDAWGGAAELVMITLSKGVCTI